MSKKALEYIKLTKYYMGLYLIESFDEMSNSDFKNFALEFNIKQDKNSLGRVKYKLERHISSIDILKIYLLINDIELYLGHIKFNMKNKNDIHDFSINVPVAYINRRTFNSVQDIFWTKKNEYINGINYIDKVSSLLLGKSLFIDGDYRFNEGMMVILGPFTLIANCCIMVTGNTMLLHYIFTVNKFDLATNHNEYLGPFCGSQARSSIETYLSETYTYPMFQKSFSKLTKKEYLLLEMAI